MLDDDTMIRRWLAERQPTYCPTAAVAATTATLSPADVAALQAHPEPVRAKGRKLPPHMHRTPAENQAAKLKPQKPRSRKQQTGMPSRKRRDFTGQRFVHLVALSYLYTKGTKAYWLMRCDCGNEKPMRADDLKKNKACGCKLGRPEMEYADITGRRYGAVTVIEQLPPRKRGKPDPRGRLHSSDRYWRCRCDCGNEFATRTSSLNRYFKDDRCACRNTRRRLLQVSEQGWPNPQT